MLNFLDRIQFLNIKIWDFSVRSLIRVYGREFMTKIILRHPIKTIKGIQHYRNSPGTHIAVDRSCNFKSNADLSITGVGFCLKPLDPPCVSGRANHDCLFFERNLHLTNQVIPCCEECRIQKIGRLAFAAGHSFYIMTSAWDILHDVFLPALNKRQYSKGIFALCRYSFEPFKLALSIARIEADLIPYERGDCADYHTWLLADDGIKEERTELSVDNLNTIEQLIQQSATADTIPNQFNKIGNLFYPQ